MSPLKIMNLFQDMMPNFFPKNVGLEVSRPANFMINRTQLKPKKSLTFEAPNKYYMLGKRCEPLHFCWGTGPPTKFSKKRGGKGFT